MITPANSVPSTVPPRLVAPEDAVGVLALLVALVPLGLVALGLGVGIVIGTVPPLLSNVPLLPDPEPLSVV